MVAAQRILNDDARQSERPLVGQGEIFLRCEPGGGKTSMILGAAMGSSLREVEGGVSHEKRMDWETGGLAGELALVSVWLFRCFTLIASLLCQPRGARQSHGTIGGQEERELRLFGHYFKE